MSALEKLKMVRSKLLWEHPFWGTLSLRLEFREMGEETRTWAKEILGSKATMATNGKSIEYAPEFVESLSDQELMFVLAHEVCHCMLQHHLRREGRDAMLWNIAGDLVINDMLKENSCGTAPPNTLSDEKGEFKDMSAEEVYAKLMKKAQKGSGGGKGKGVGGSSGGKEEVPGWGAVKDAPSGTSVEVERAKRKAAVEDAATAAKSIGKLPAGIERIINKIIVPKVDWRQVLATWLQERLPVDYSWLRRNRRFTNVYLPGRDGFTIGRIVIAIDTSGSCWSEDILSRFLGAVQGLRQSIPCHVDIISCDVQPTNHRHYAPHESILDYKLCGGGGTDFVPAFEWVKKNINPLPAGLIYLTDLYGNFPSKKPAYKVLWVTLEENPVEVPFGKVLKIK